MTKLTTVYIVTESGDLLTGAVKNITESLSAENAGWRPDGVAALGNFISRKQKEIESAETARAAIRNATRHLEKLLIQREANK